MYTWVVALAACDVFPPTAIEDGEGRLDADDPSCAIYPTDGYASVNLDGVGMLEVTLPSTAGVWGRGTVAYGEEDLRDPSCTFPGGAVGARIQYGATSVPKPDCDRCTEQYRALFIEGLSFAGGPNQCEGGSFCGYDDCRAVEPASAKSFYVWCYSLEDTLP
jgi:hypothetical protein